MVPTLLIPNLFSSFTSSTDEYQLSPVIFWLVFSIGSMSFSTDKVGTDKRLGLVSLVFPE